MIRFVRGSLFDSELQTLVNPVNRVGVSGAGLAKEFKKRWPDMHRDYALACKERRMPNVRLTWTHPHEHMVLCFVTKEDWRDPSDLALIEQGLDDFARSAWLRDHTITSVAFPALGCGNGGLEWDKVRSLMLGMLRRVEIPIEIYEPMDGVGLARSARPSRGAMPKARSPRPR